jgi:uncharacterized membrane protein YedE/YeeE
MDNNKKSDEKVVAAPIVNNNQPLILIKSSTLGFLFGFVLEKSKVYDPSVIKDQLIFKRFIMLKMFFSALAASTLVILFYRNRFQAAYTKIYESMRDQLKVRSTLSLVGGGVILGFGMALAGSCPGMIFVQLGAGVTTAYFTLLGGFIGAYVHGRFHDNLNNLTKPNPKASLTLYDMLKIKPNTLHVIIGGGLLSVVALLELLFPWRTDLKIDPNQSSYGITAKSWPPMYAGLLLGSLQLVSFVLLKRILGNSPPFTIVASHLLNSSELDKNAYMKKWRFGNWDRMTMAIGVFLGSFVSANLSGVYGKTNGLTLVNSVLGGFMLVFGARFADGCNTGHGISGTSNLFFGASIAMVSMFAGAMGLSAFL